MGIIGFLASTNYIIYNKNIAKLLGVDEAILLGELCSCGNMYGENEFFYLQQDRIIADTALSEYKIRNATKSLVQSGVIAFAKKGVPAKYYYKVLGECLSKLLEGVDFLKSENCTSRGCTFDTSSGAEIKGLNNKQEIINNNNKLVRKKVSKKESSGTFDSLIDTYTTCQNLKDSLIEFIKMRKLIKKPMTNKALELIFEKLDKLANSNADKVTILNQSICNSWQGVFELKQDNTTKQTRGSSVYDIIDNLE